MNHPRMFAVGLGGLLLALASCSPASQAPAESTAASQAAGGTTVNVTLSEWAVAPDAESAPAGDVTFVVTNDGPDDVHEFVILRTDLDPAELPTAADGSVEEAGAGIEVVDEIEDIPVGETQELTATLEAGDYVLLCNIYTESENEAHYALGMRIAFTVE